MNTLINIYLDSILLKMFAELLRRVFRIFKRTIIN